MNKDVKKVSRSTIIILIVIAALVSLLVVFSTLNRQDTGIASQDAEADETVAGDTGGAEGAAASPKPGTFTVIADGKALRTYTVDDLKKFPPFEIRKDIASGKHDDESGLFKGAPLEDILDDAVPDWKGKYKEFIFRAEDAFTSSVFASDVEKGDNVIIVYAQDGAPLPGSADGGKGPLRALIADDEFGNRSAQMLVSVELKE
jgi:DMSO/TMAO reductase YedYZ molybdopterin-dependent catalytic subunit